MNKYINLDEAIDLFRGIDATMVGSFVADTLENLATIDIVYCAECANNKCNTDGVADNWCLKFGCDVEGDDYCSHGERIDNE